MAVAGLSTAIGCAGARAPASAAPLLVFAAADLRDALPEVAAAYRRAGGDSVVIVFGATGDLAAQLANGAPADLFFAADESTPARLAAQRALVDRSRRVYAIGRLALATGPGAPSGTAAGGTTSGGPTAGGAPRALQLADLTRPAVRAIVLADPAHAPYGRAAQDALEHAGLLAQLRPKLVYAPNVAQAFRVVQGGNADAGFVSLAAVSGAGTHVAFVRVDPALYAPIRQAAAVVATSAHRDGAARFLDYVTGPGFAVLRRYGYGHPSAGDPPGGAATASAATASAAAGSAGAAAPR